MTMQSPYVSFELLTGAPGIHVPAEVLVRWFGRELSAEEVDRLATALDTPEVRDSLVSILAAEADVAL